MQKIGDFDVEASTVIEMHRLLEADKMKRFSCPDSQGSAFTDEFLEFRQAYDSYLANCNMIDVIDVFSKVREEVSHNGDLLRDLSSNIIVISKPKGQVEVNAAVYLNGNCIEFGFTYSYISLHAQCIKSELKNKSIFSAIIYK